MTTPHSFEGGFRGCQNSLLSQREVKTLVWVNSLAKKQISKENSRFSKNPVWEGWSRIEISPSKRGVQPYLVSVEKNCFDSPGYFDFRPTPKLNFFNLRDLSCNPTPHEKQKRKLPHSLWGGECPDILCTCTRSANA